MDHLFGDATWLVLTWSAAITACCVFLFLLAWNSEKAFTQANSLLSAEREQTKLLEARVESLQQLVGELQQP